MDERCRRNDRFIVRAVMAVLVGFALLSDGFTTFRVEPAAPSLSGPDRRDAGSGERARRWVSQVDEPIVSTTEP